MMTTSEALARGFEYVETIPGDISSGYWSFKFGDGYELAIEPLMFGQMYVGVYKDEELLTQKIPVKPIDKKNEL